LIAEKPNRLACPTVEPELLGSTRVRWSEALPAGGGEGGGDEADGDAVGGGDPLALAAVAIVETRAGATGQGMSVSLLPGLRRLRAYQPSWLRSDVLAGVIVAAYLVPQCMAYGELAGVAPIAGLWAMLLYALIGSSPQLSVGPESTTAVMTAAAIAPIAAGDPLAYASFASLLALLVGVVCVGGLGAVGVSGGTAVETDLGGLHGRGGGDHDQRPDRQDQRPGA
jgi:hypothetical protein